MKARQGLIAAMTLLAGCGSEAPPGGAPVAAQYADAEAGFDGPPRVVALMSRGGGLLLSGVATPDAQIRLATPHGRAFTAVADERGAWRVPLPNLAEAALFGLSSRHEGRTVQAEGYIAVLPGPVPSAALLRAAAGASPIQQSPKVLTIAAVDVDAAGAAVVSGAGQPGAAFRVSVDGAASGEGVVSDSGRFAIALTRPLSVGDHAISVREANSGAVAQARLALTPPRASASGPVVAQRVEGAWRLDWMTPGGGLQTTVLFDRSGAGA